MLDMAASVARAEMTLNVLEGSLILIGSTEIPLVGFTKFLGAFSADG